MEFFFPMGGLLFLGCFLMLSLSCTLSGQGESRLAEEAGWVERSRKEKPPWVGLTLEKNKEVTGLKEPGHGHSVFFEYETGRMVHRFVVPSLLDPYPRPQGQCREKTECPSTWLDYFVGSSLTTSVEVFWRHILDRAGDLGVVALNDAEIRRIDQLIRGVQSRKMASLINLEDIYFEKQFNEGEPSKEQFYRLWIMFQVSQNAEVSLLSWLTETFAASGEVVADQRLLGKIRLLKSAFGATRIGH